MYGKEIKKILVTREQIAKRVKELGEQITRDYAGEPLTLVCTLRGATLFFADLVREIRGDVEIDFIACSSYGAGTTSSGEVKMIKDLSSPIAGKNIIVVEDIIDTGTTLYYLKKLLEARNPKSLKVCSFLDKPSRRKVEFKGDYIGFEIENEYVVGYGLDYDQKMRNLPDVCVLAPEVYMGDLNKVL
ncbi:MAG: hypoxanthine phosphoribosyltransferase [Clostridia bacterium]|nr:hypoxanthine phosphoribosyltransferase [Clostridia bacterium]